jgi:hypothetical protein
MLRISRFLKLILYIVFKDTPKVVFFVEPKFLAQNCHECSWHIIHKVLILEANSSVADFTVGPEHQIQG